MQILKGRRSILVKYKSQRENHQDKNEVRPPTIENVPINEGCLSKIDAAGVTDDGIEGDEDSDMMNIMDDQQDDTESDCEYRISYQVMIHVMNGYRNPNLNWLLFNEIKVTSN